MNKQDIALNISAGGFFLCAQPGVAKYKLIGSALYMDADVDDVDFAVLLRPDGRMGPREWCSLVVDIGDHWAWCSMYAQGKARDSETWFSIRRKIDAINLNLMVTDDVRFYDAYVHSMEICRGARITDKAQRIAICKMVRDGLSADDVLAGK